MKLSPRPLIAAVYAALLFPLYGQAQLYNYSIRILIHAARK